MGRLEVTFTIGLAHPLIMRAAPEAPIAVKFGETGNTVYIDPPDRLPVTEYQKSAGAFDRFTLRVCRECTDEEAKRAAVLELEKLQIFSDAGRAFWMLFESIRESNFRQHNTLPGYPVVPAEKIQNNALVRTCEAQLFYDGVLQRTIPLSSHPAITITEHAWDEAIRRLAAQQAIPVHVSFALDAACFVESDPVRAIVMACAAWETALRYFLANVASKRDPAYLVASEMRGIPQLYSFVKAAKGGELFFERFGKGSDDFYSRQREYMRRLPEWRNKLLHRGESTAPQGVTVDVLLAVLNATDWLFE